MPCGWCWSTGASMPRSGRRSARSRQDRLHGGDAALLGAPGTAQCGPARRRQHGGARADPRVGTRGARTAPGQRDTAQGISVFCSGGARPPAQAIDGSAVDPVPPGSRCPGHRQGSRSSSRFGPGATRYGAVPRDPPRVRGEFPRLWRAQGVAAARAPGHHGRPLHGRAADAADGPAWRGPGPPHADHRPRPRRPLSARSCAAAVHAATAEAWDCPGLVDGSGAWLGRGSVDGSGLASYS